MHYLIQMLIAFLILCGIVLFFQQTLKVNSGEGMLLSASAIALLFVVSSQAGTFRYGFYGMLCIAGIGIPVRTVCVCDQPVSSVLSEVYRIQ